MIQLELGHFSYKYIYLFASTFFTKKKTKNCAYSLSLELEVCWLNMPLVP